MVLFFMVLIFRIYDFHVRRTVCKAGESVCRSPFCMDMDDICFTVSVAVHDDYTVGVGGHIIGITAGCPRQCDLEVHHMLMEQKLVILEVVEEDH